MRRGSPFINLRPAIMRGPWRDEFVLSNVFSSSSGSCAIGVFDDHGLFKSPPSDLGLGSRPISRFDDQGPWPPEQPNKRSTVAAATGATDSSKGFAAARLARRSALFVAERPDKHEGCGE